MDRSDRGIAAAVESGTPMQAHLVGDDQRMIGLARWLAGRGVEVTRARIDRGHAAVAPPHRARWLIYAPDVPREHPDRLAALRDGVEQAEYAAVIRGLLRRGVGIAVAGRRLGRVAAAMIGWTLEQSGLDPTFLLRGPISGVGVRAKAGLGRHAVVDLIESPGFVLDEPPGPAMIVLLDDAGLADEGILADAVNCVGPAGYVLTGPAMPPPSLMNGGRVASVSLERGSTWWGADLREERGRYRFRVFHRGRFAAEIRLQVPGRANVLGALAALAACDRAEVPTRDIKQALEEFEGVSGGFESRGSYRGVTLVDDDAADPRDVADVLALARTVHGRRRLWAVVGASGPPLPAMADALAWADRVLVLGGAVDADAWSSMLGGAGIAARGAANLDEALSDLDRHLEPGDVLLTLGSGDVGTIADAFLRRLPRDRQGR
ncbi:MAG TPA: UDP-N-acetylmuramate--alanine ligase [Isosphaeraceae bacterium]